MVLPPRRTPRSPHPGRPLLRPGFAVLRRDTHTLQVGLYPPERAVLADTPEVRHLLELLMDSSRRWREPEDPRAARALRDLTDAHLVLNAYGQPWDRSQAQAHGAAWPTMRIERAEAAVLVSGPDSLSTALIDLLATEGVKASTHHLSDGIPPRTTTVWVLMAAGPMPRDLTDQARGPTLSVSFTEGRSEIGPFTLPGSSTCLRCVDANRCDTDPRWPLLIEQAATLPTLPPPVELAATQLTLALMAREVLSWIDGQTPDTWGATIAATASGLPTRNAWDPHPACGCTWEPLLLSS